MPDDDGQDAPKAPIRTGVLVVTADVNPDALRAALVGVRAPELLVIDRPKAVEPEAPIDVVLPTAIARPVNRSGDRPGGRRLGRPGDHSLLCQLLDRPAKRRGLPFVCICGGSRR